MTSIFAMQRANGDWFALKHRGSLRVPVFSTDREAMQARAFNVELLVFNPVRLDERALRDLEPVVGDPLAHFWLVDKDSRSMRRGVALNHAELSLVIRGDLEDPPQNGSTG